jgi:hypothetical protein
MLSEFFIYVIHSDLRSMSIYINHLKLIKKNKARLLRPCLGSKTRLVKVLLRLKTAG